MAIATAALAKRWQLRDDPQDVPHGDWPPIIGRLLAFRGVTGDDEARAFFDTSPPATLALPDLERAVERLAIACRAGETVAIFGDFDVDGVTASALLTESLAALGARPLPYLPHRSDEGYGLNTNAIDSLAGLGATLLVTADCGTSSIDEVAHATRGGLDVLILDHHTVPDRLPLGAAIVNPKRDASMLDEPSAGGIAYYVIRALYEALNRPLDESRLLDLVALSTVCDVAPLVGENRRLVRSGLAAIAQSERPGLRALLEVAAVDPRRVDTEAIGFALGPRLNAAGRLAHARLAFDLLLERDEERAWDLARELDSLNRQRQQATEAALMLAEELVEPEADAPLIMIGHADFPLGIVGLVAARLCDSHRRPAVVYQLGEGDSRASCRSIDEFHITDALRSCGELFERYGGHRAAAGFTAKNDRLPQIKERLLATAGQELAGLDLRPAIEIDAELPLASLRGDEIRWLAKMAPCGAGNPEPVFLSRDVLVAERRQVGADGRHLKLKLRDGAVSWSAIAFRQDGDGIEEGARVDLVYSLSTDRRRSDGLELRVLDVRPAAG
jgi:single-stranded-DNA-specific exonuclease